MKTPDVALTEWTTDAIIFDMGDDEGVYRVYTREAFKRLCSSFLNCTGNITGQEQLHPFNVIWEAVHRLKGLIDEAKKLHLKDNLPVMNEKDSLERFFDVTHMLRIDSVAEIRAMFNPVRSTSMILVHGDPVKLPEDAQ